MEKPTTTDADLLSQADNQEAAERLGVSHWWIGSWSVVLARIRMFREAVIFRKTEIDGGVIAGHCWWQFEMQTVAKIESFVVRIPWCFVVSCSSPPFRSRLEDHKLALILFALSLRFVACHGRFWVEITSCRQLEMLDKMLA